VVWVAGAVVFLEGASHPRRLQVQSGLLLTVFTTLMLFTGSVMAALHPGAPLYRPAEEVNAFEFIASLPDRDPVVLTSYATGNSLPAWAQVYVVIGHGPESIHLSELRDPVANFYKSMTPDADRLKLIRQFNVRYVFHGPAESQLGDWDPGTAAYMRQIYNRGGYAVYQIDASQVDQ
jgi:hypothetical protein